MLSGQWPPRRPRRLIIRISILQGGVENWPEEGENADDDGPAKHDGRSFHWFASCAAVAGGGG